MLGCLSKIESDYILSSRTHDDHVMNLNLLTEMTISYMHTYISGRMQRPVDHGMVGVSEVSESVSSLLRQPPLVLSSSLHPLRLAPSRLDP